MSLESDKYNTVLFKIVVFIVSFFQEFRDSVLEYRSTLAMNAFATYNLQHMIFIINVRL